MARTLNYLDPEYHSFGPWIFEIGFDYPMPPIFVPYYKEQENCLLLIKVPRNIERKDARPGMDLYDYVIGMYGTYGYILRRKDKEIEEIKFSYDQVVSIENYRDLLLGLLTIHLPNDDIIIRYNTVSEDIILKLVKIIRDRYAQKKYDKIPIKNKIEALEISERFYENIINKMNSDGDSFDIMAFQPAVKASNGRNNLFQKLLRHMRPKLLLSTVHLCSSRELLVIDKGRPIRYLKETAYSYRFTFISLEKIYNIKFERCEKYDEIKIVYISTGRSSYKFYFDEKNENLIYFYKKLNDLNNLTNP